MRPRASTPSWRSARRRGRGAEDLSMLVDSHCHLDAREFDGDRPAVLAAARAAGVGAFLVPGVEVAGFPDLATLAATEPDLAPAYGIHPLYVARASDADLEAVEDWVAKPETVAVGEIGLDRYVQDLPQERLALFYEEQLRLAQRHGRPVILHVRRAVEDIIRHLAATLPIEGIVLETDAPDMPPEWAQGQRNEPANLARYAYLLAELRGIPVEEVAAATTANALRVVPGLRRAMGH